MKVERLFLVALAAALVLLVLQWRQAPIEHPPGVLVTHGPEQEPLTDTSFDHGQGHIG